MPKGRQRGACLQCARSKRRCDHKQPQCTQCAKHGQECELQTFKISTPAVFDSRHLRRPVPKKPLSRPAPSQPELQTLPSSLLSATSNARSVSDSGASQSSPGASGDLDFWVADSNPEIATGIVTALPNALLPHLAAEPLHGSNDHGASRPRDECPVPIFTSPSQLMFTGGVATGPDLTEAINSTSPSSLTMPPFDDHVLEIATRNDMFPDAAALLGCLRNMGASSTFELSAEFVPRHLYCPMPWPPDMLASSERRFLWQYFLSIAEADFLCVDWEDVGHLYDFQHPYITTLPRMALSNDALRGAIFCFAASQYQLRHGRSDFEATKGFTSSEAALALSAQMSRDTDDSGLLSMISAATLLHWYGTEPHDYLRVASLLVSQYLTRTKSTTNATTSFPEVPLTEFRWSVVSTLCSLQQPSSPLGGHVCGMIEMSENEIQRNYSRAFERWVSHPIYSFSPRLVNPLLRIGLLLETQLLQLELEDGDIQPDPSWPAHVSEAEDMLLQARDRDINVSRSALGSADPAAILALNESMYAAGAVLLYARIHGLPPTAPLIRRQTQIIVDEVSKIPVDSRVSFALVFPLFIAGCEAMEQMMRDTIVQRLRDPGGVTYVRGDLVGALRQIWDIRDLEPGLPWPHWVRKVEPRYRISCLI
ncbi:hypothetical protein HYQ45_011988 [Verticillium longisporum]|uniref:Zn(2)-C6 fungal-type domain-containing protein n=1 Tax=Verticillium longisporum TaxID=100787 RepID=A0A8I2ZDM0_VERLO|nr:hypothetical protein HYQ45_011988 [Verticillium longisporum]